MAQPILKISESKQGNVLVLALSGELDAKTAPDLRTHLDNSIQAGAIRVVLDCKSLTYVASAGIGTLNAVQKALVQKSGQMVLCHVAKDIKDTMDLMYFTKKVKVFPGLEEALQAF